MDVKADGARFCRYRLPLAIYEFPLPTVFPIDLLTPSVPIAF